MTINFISSVMKYKGKLAIGIKETNNLLIFNKYDMQVFKEITMNSLDKTSKLDKNVVVMGYNTWKSINKKNGLPERINIVLTSKFHEKFWKFSTIKNLYFMTFDLFEDFYEKYTPNVFVIGGESVYSLFLNHNNRLYHPTKVYITEYSQLLYSQTEYEPNVFFPKLPDWYKLLYYHKKTDYMTFLCYKNNHFKQDSFDKSYLSLIKRVLANGSLKYDRTGVGTISSFGESFKIDVSRYAPLLTTKNMNWKAIIEELLWFLRGDTDAKILSKKGIKIWDGNTSKDFLKQRGLDYSEGVLGPGYGWQWRHFGAEYDEKYADSSINTTTDGFDQIKYIINLLRNDPSSRRIVLSAWNPAFLREMALPPCHLMAIFNVEYTTDNKKILNCHLICRSTDVGLGLPYNIFSYTVLMYILAIKCDMTVGSLFYTGTDVHIYNNHIEKLKEQIQRKPTVQSILRVNKSIKHKDFNEITVEDFEVIGYYPEKHIKMDMAV